MSLDSLLSFDSVLVEQQATAQDASGGPTRTWSTVYAAVACRVLDPSASERLRFLMLGTEAPHRVLHQQGGIGQGMRLTTSDGRKLKVQGTRTVRALGGLSTYYESEAVEWRPGA